MKSLFEQMIGVKVSCDYTWNDDGIVRIGAGRDIVAYAASEPASRSADYAILFGVSIRRSTDVVFFFDDDFQ